MAAFSNMVMNILSFIKSSEYLLDKALSESQEHSTSAVKRFG
jgi:hypothetical protein